MPAATSWNARCAAWRKGAAPGEVLEALSQALTNKLMHGPTSALHHAQEPDRDTLVRLLERVYQIRTRE